MCIFMELLLITFVRLQVTVFFFFYLPQIQQLLNSVSAKHHFWSNICTNTNICTKMSFYFVGIGLQAASANVEFPVLLLGFILDLM